MNNHGEFGICFAAHRDPAHPGTVSGPGPAHRTDRQFQLPVRILRIGFAGLILDQLLAGLGQQMQLVLGQFGLALAAGQAHGVV